MTDYTKIYSDPWEIVKRLTALSLDLISLKEVAAIAVGAGAESTINDPANAPGIFSYIYGTRALREKFVSGDKPWKRHREQGVEAIIHEETKVTVVFQNVDSAGNDLKNPKPRSKKGSASNRICAGNSNQMDLPLSVPEYSRKLHPAYYLCVDEEGNVELSRPIIINNTFAEFVDRMFLGTIDELAPIQLDNSTENRIPDTIDIKITPKK